MKDRTTHLAYEPEHAVDLDTGVVVAAQIHPADEGATTTLSPTLEAAACNLAEVGLARARTSPASSWPTRSHGEVDSDQLWQSEVANTRLSSRPCQP